MKHRGDAFEVACDNRRIGEIENARIEAQFTRQRLICSRWRPARIGVSMRSFATRAASLPVYPFAP